MTSYTMDDFRAEMHRRGVYARPSPRLRPRTKGRCTTCGGTEFVDAIDNNGHPYRGCKRCRIMPPEEVIAKTHGNTVIEVVPCGVHPLHAVKVRASGARSGCPMCEMQVEDLCRSFDRPSIHSPIIAQSATKIVGCTCGWRTPPGAADSDDAYAEHAAIVRATEGDPR